MGACALLLSIDIYFQCKTPADGRVQHTRSLVFYIL